MNKGIKLYNKNQFTKARGIFEEILETRGLDINALKYLIKIEYKLGHFVKCREKIEFFLTLEPQNKHIIRTKIRLLKEQKKMDELFDYLEFL